MKKNSQERKKALVTGCNGQDGSYLMEFLLDKGYEVYGMVRRLSCPNYQNIKHLLGSVNLIYGDMTDITSIVKIVKDGQFDEIYNLAAQSSPAESFKQPFLTTDVNALGSHRLFEAVSIYSPQTRVYQASTSEMFGNAFESPQRETTQFNPSNPYAVSKMYAHQMAHIYRNKGLFVACGILFNHESERRGLQFVTQKICYGVACISLGMKESPALNEENEPLVKDGKISLGNLDAKRDWGYSPDYVRGMWMLLQLNMPDDFVIATGEQHSIRELVQTAFKFVGIEDWEKYIYVDPRFVRKDTCSLLGDPTKIKSIGWKTDVDFKKLVEKMVENNINQLK
ncbi:GDP-mannose 4,6-dehydratase [Patescibacteria group bacterium]|nr:GDP-mannose 4,6-dehydratase [Patescibacteria group bacterium]